MMDVIPYVGAVVSTIAAVFAWYFNHQMKRFELAQMKATTILEKRFTYYPAVWTLCQALHAKLVARTAHKADVAAFGAALTALYTTDGLYYSLELQKAIGEVINSSITPDPADPLMPQLLSQWINGGGPFQGILPTLQDDLGAYVSNAASVLHKRA